MTETPSAIGAAAAAADTGAGEIGNVSQSCPKVKLEIGVFFDGTNNNAVNSMIGGSEGSYANARSNVALLSVLYKNSTREWVRNSCGGYALKYSRIYMAGIGTETGEEDHTFPGSALGMGATGVESRVYEACIRVGQEVRRLSPGDPAVELTMDVFGFSRGAAAARYFVNCFRQGYIEYDRYFVNRRRAEIIRGLTVKFRFIGIFDTVAAIGYGQNDWNWPVNVHLKTAQADRIQHLTARNEFRQNFRLNKNTPGGGDTRALPGAHSDVGGGYRDAGDEVMIQNARTLSFPRRETAADARGRLLSRAASQRAADEAIWIREGWINPGETTGGVVANATPVASRSEYSLMGGATTVYHFRFDKRLSRPWVQIGLSRIPLRIMYDKAKEAGVPFRAFGSTGEYTVPPGLRPVASKLVGGGSLTAAENRFVLRNYGHISANIGAIGMSPEDDHVRVEYDNRASRAV